MYNNHCINHLSNYSLTAYPIVYTFIYDHCHQPFPFPFQSSIHLSLITDSYSYDALKFLAPPYLSFSFAMRLLNASKKNPKKLFHQNFSNTGQLGKNYSTSLSYFSTLWLQLSMPISVVPVSLLQQVALQWVNSVFK